MRPDGIRDCQTVSFQLYLQSFAHGQPHGFTRDDVRRAFAGGLVELEDDYWQADFGAAGRSDLFLSFLTDGSERIHSLSIDHPSMDDRLWRAIWTLLGLPGTIFHFPGSAAPLARDPGAAAALSPDMLNALGQPITTTGVQDLLYAVMEHLAERERE